MERASAPDAKGSGRVQTSEPARRLIPRTPTRPAPRYGHAVDALAQPRPSRARRLAGDLVRLARDRQTISTLLEVDVTEPRTILRQHRERTGETLSFTAFVVSCVAATVASMPELHAYRDWRGRLVVFPDVDVLVTLEPDARRGHLPTGHIIRAADRKRVRAIHREIRRAQLVPGASNTSDAMEVASRIPWPLRLFGRQALAVSPRLARSLRGTVAVTSVGMFARRATWGVYAPTHTHTLGVTVGGIATKPAMVDGYIAPRDILHLTIDYDHDIVDGAPAARYADALAGRLERGDGLARPAD